MEGRAPLQALLRRKIKEYHEASHFTIGWDLGPDPKGAATQHQTDFPVRWGDFRRQAAPRPQSSDVLNKEEGQPYQPETETMEKFHGKLPARRPPIYPTPVGGMILEDPAEQRPLTLTQETYRWHKNIHQPEKITPDKWRSKIILGNDEPMLPAITSYQDSYRDPDKVLKGSLPWRDETGHCEHQCKFPANGRLPALPHTEQSDSSNERWAYKPMPPQTPRPDSVDMKRGWHMAKAGLGDWEERLETPRAAAFPWEISGCEKGQLEHREKYLADARFPALPYPESESSTGEPPQTPKQALKPTPPKGPRLDPKKRWRRANALAEKRFETTTATEFQWKTCERRKPLKCPDVMFQVINGDPEPEKKLDKGTTYYHFFGKPTNKDMRRIRSDPQKNEPLCVTIPGQPISCSTAYKEHFQWAPAGYRKPEPIESEMYKSHFELKLPGTGPMTSITQDFYAGRKLENGKKRSKPKKQCKPELSIEEQLAELNKVD